MQHAIDGRVLYVVGAERDGVVEPMVDHSGGGCTAVGLDVHDLLDLRAQIDAILRSS